MLMYFGILYNLKMFLSENNSGTWKEEFSHIHYFGYVHILYFPVRENCFFLPDLSQIKFIKLFLFTRLKPNKIYHSVSSPISGTSCYGLENSI